MAGNFGDVARPVGCDARRHHEALLRQRDGRLQQALDRPGAVVLQQAHPAADGAGHRDGMGAVRLDACQVRFGEPGRGGALGRPARGVERDQLARAGLGNESEAVAADARHVRLDDGEHGGGGDGRVDGVAALAQHLDAGEAGRGMRGGAHGPAPIGERAAGRVEAAHASLRDVREGEPRGSRHTEQSQRSASRQSPLPILLQNGERKEEYRYVARLVSEMASLASVGTAAVAPAGSP